MQSAEMAVNSEWQMDLVEALHEFGCGDVSIYRGPVDRNRTDVERCGMERGEKGGVKLKPINVLSW